MEKNKQSKAPLVITLTLLILVVGGTAHDFRLQKAWHTATATTTPPDDSKQTLYFITTQGYEVAVPKGYEMREDKQNGTVAFLKIVKLGVDQQSLIISRTKSTATDPCTIKPPGFVHPSCQSDYDYRMLDWGTPQKSFYTVIGAGYAYTLQFINISDAEKRKILSTFRIV